MEKYRASRYCKSIQTQTSNSFEKVNTSHQILEQEIQKEIIDSKLTEKKENKIFSKETDIKIELKIDRISEKKKEFVSDMIS